MVQGLVFVGPPLMVTSFTPPLRMSQSVNLHVAELRANWWSYGTFWLRWTTDPGSNPQPGDASQNFVNRRSFSRFVGGSFRQETCGFPKAEFFHKCDNSKKLLNGDSYDAQDSINKWYDSIKRRFNQNCDFKDNQVADTWYFTRQNMSSCNLSDASGIRLQPYGKNLTPSTCASIGRLAVADETAWFFSWFFRSYRIHV